MFPWIFSAAAIFWSAALIGGFYFARRYVRALERRAADESELLELRRRVAYLEQALGQNERHIELPSPTSRVAEVHALLDSDGGTIG